MNFDARMRQTAIGHWPAMSFPAVIVAWEQLKIKRDKGIDPEFEARRLRNYQYDAVESQRVTDEEACTLGILCDDYMAVRKAIFNMLGIFISILLCELR